MSKQKPKTCAITAHTKKPRSRKWKHWFRRGLNPQLSCLSTQFWQKCTTPNDSCSLSSLYTSVFNALYGTNKSRYPLAINIFEFQMTCIKFCSSPVSMCAWNAKWQCQESWSSKKRTCKKYNFQEKNCTPTGIWTPYLILESQLLYQLHYICALWFAKECCSASSSSTCCRAQTECCVNWWW